MVEYRLNYPDENNNVQSIYLSPNEIQKMMDGSTAIEVTITRRSLSTTKQPFSIVMTGGFEYNSVSVKQDLDPEFSKNKSPSILSSIKSSNGNFTELEEILFWLVCCCL